MNSSLMRSIALTAVGLVAVTRFTFGQTESSTSPEANGERRTDSSLSEAAVQSRIALYSDTTKGQYHAEDAREFQAVAEHFIATLSARDTKNVQPLCSVPFLLEDERILDQESVTARLREIVFPGVFALARNKRVLILDTLEQTEQLLEKRVPTEARRKWIEHTARSSRIAVVSGGPMVVGLSLRKSDGKHLVSGLLFAYFPTRDDTILKAMDERLLNKR
jgi:hypothetical protein